jgi:hypothetical protein
MHYTICVMGESFLLAAPVRYLVSHTGLGGAANAIEPGVGTALVGAALGETALGGPRR